jgi:hypothetical protein
MNTETIKANIERHRTELQKAIAERDAARQRSSEMEAQALRIEGAILGLSGLLEAEEKAQAEPFEMIEE